MNAQEQTTVEMPDGAASVLNGGLCHTDIVDRLRDTPNWKREEFRGWKENCSVFDRAPFEAADEIERLRAEMDALFDAIRAVYKDVGTPGDYGYHTKTGKALAYLYNTNNAVDNHNLGECGRLAREYQGHNFVFSDIAVGRKPQCLSKPAQCRSKPGFCP